jgi:hypothetical protein
MSGKPFRCPACGCERRTLRDLLTCCPRETRVMLANTIALGGSGPSLGDLLGGNFSAAMYARLLPAPATGAGDAREE